MSAMTHARILVVEDDRVVARDIQRQLERIGHQVLGMTARGEDAISLALQTRPDLVLMDIRLEGGIDGIEAAQLIREQCQSPVVFLTAYADDETVQRASRTEPFGYLLKPFEDSQLRTVIEMALYKHAAERKLRESERRYATTLSSIGDAVIATDGEARVTFLNPVAESLTGWSREEASGRLVTDVFRIVNEETRDAVEDPAVKALRLGITVGLANHTILIARDGREFPIDDCGAPIIDDHGSTTGAVLVFRDMTQRYRASQALRESQNALERVGRLSAMGEMTVSIAHEVNQPLMAIVTNAATCLRWLADEKLNIEEARLAAERIVRDGHRAGEVVARIRALARKSAPVMARLDLNAAILEVLLLTRGELRHHAIGAETELATDARYVLGDRIQIEQIVLNLIMNGIEAINASQRPTRLVRICSKRADEGYVLVTVTDTGAGLDPATSDRIFEAFFTTKAQGIGIGLSICRSIVEAHGGQMWASPNRPHGSIFSFTLKEFPIESPSDGAGAMIPTPTT